MGRFSTNINVKCADFADKFTEIMKKRGYETCTEDYATLSYVIAQGQFWATLAEKNYNSDIRMTLDDTKFIAKELNTPAFMLEVVDSDFAMIKLNGTEVIVGNGSGYGMDNTQTPDRTLWEPLVTDGTFERLTEIWQTHEVFVEDALAKSAPLLGIEPQFITADYREISEMSDGGNVTKLCFKKIGAGKPLTLKTAFVKVFGEGLKPLGFKRLKNLKNKYPYFVRVVNGDILHVVSYRQTTSPKVGYKEFEVYCGVITLYRRIINFTIEPNNILINIFHLYNKAVECGKIEPVVNNPQVNYMCNATDSAEMLSKLKLVFNDLMGILQNYIDKIADLRACVEYFKTFNGVKLYPFDEFITLKQTSYSEALLLVKTHDMDDSLKRVKKEYKDYDFSYLGKNPKQEDIERFLKKKNDEREEQYELRLEMINNPELNKRVLDEMERCKANNIELLKSYGITVD